MSLGIRVSPRLRAGCEATAEGGSWLERLPDIVRDVCQRWSLAPGTPLDAAEATCAWIAAVRRRDGREAVLKVALPHFEGRHEIHGLRFWAGEPTARLLEADETQDAMLLERCTPGTPLRSLPEVTQDVVIAGLLRRLWRVPPVGHPFRPLSVMLQHWTAALEQPPVADAGLIRTALEILAELSGTAALPVLLATDLHAGNVLQARREPWLVIDPKPFCGDAAYDATQHLLNCSARVAADPVAVIGRFADLLEVSAERVQLWTFARAATHTDAASMGVLALARALAP